MTDEQAQPDPTTTEEPAEAPRTKTRLRDRALGIRGIAAVALASLVLGGAAGTAIGFAADDGGGNHGPGRFGRPFADDEGRPGPGDGFRPPGEPGQAPPSTAPDEQVQPDGSTESSSSSNS